MTVCPLYQNTFQEADVARGKLALLEMMDRDVMVRSGRFREILSRCLLCGACGEACASSVETKTLIQEGRQLLFKTKRGHWFENPLVRSLREGDLSGSLIPKGGALLQALFCRKIPQSSGLHLRFPLSFFVQRASIPAIRWTPFIEDFHRKVSQALESAKVGLFVGCGTNYLFPEAAWALVRLMKQLGLPVVVPRDQGCCGLPAFVSGDMKTARTLAMKNIQAFRESSVDVVLTLCASCGSHLNHLETLFEEDDPWRSEARTLSAKHHDAMAFLMEDADLTSLLENPPGRQHRREKKVSHIAYHEPCHLRIGQSGGPGPRHMLEALEGVELLEGASADLCCGHGGGFNLLHYDLSMQILDQRIHGFRGATLDAIVSGCTGCLLQFQEGVARHDLSDGVEICHPLVIVDRWLGLAPYGAKG
jgi:glycolate oxidase iron-sulfur subunit